MAATQLKLNGKKRTYSADGIKGLLAVKHSGDVFVPECKDGPTHYSNHVRLDAWVMNRSWANACVTGYEVKVSRSDFVSDNKWMSYLPLCNQFYFVAPPGVIDPAELSPDCGLMVVAGEGSGTRLLTKKKAPYRQVEIPEAIYRYILMCRVKVQDPEPTQTAQETWGKWLARKNEDRRLGYEVSKAIREKSLEIERENQRLTTRHQTYDSLLALLATLGISPDAWSPQRDLQERIEAQAQVFDPELVGNLKSAHRTLESALLAIDKLGRRDV